ncbi:hypothetical protein SAMN05216222_2779 [Pseudomonas prosekii]|uniref:Uncharacterized protein n=1 Tax=Pseudomonas prosekii TaxID=1148509 RepID=A0A1H1WLP0_9PSED|nr:hypothetical protein SAMN05216222_2779 [Pseudomonas prosekii]
MPTVKRILRATCVKFNIVYSFLLLVCAVSVWADNKNMICDPDSNVCSVAVANNYCASGEVANTKWDIRSGAYVLSCECDCTSQENTFWLIDTAGKSPVKTIYTSKIVSSIDIEKNKGGVPDLFGLVPYCTNPQVNSEVLINLKKIPGPEGATQPYCYSVEKSVAAEVCTTTDCEAKKSLVMRDFARFKEESLSEFKNATARLYKEKVRFQNFPKQQFVAPYVSTFGYSKSDQQSYNDIAYYWQQAGFNDDAIWLLEKVISSSPSRMVAYLNIADAYWSKGEQNRASDNYKKYIDLMMLSGKKQKIPERATNRSK